MWINESQSLSKKLAASKKRMMNIGYIPCITQIYQFSWRRQKKKNELSASEQFQFGKYLRIISKKFYQVTELMTDFPMQDSKSTSKQFYYRTVFFFFCFNIVCQLLARHLSREIKIMKDYSDRLKPCFAQIKPSFTCTYLALVFIVNKWKSILIKKTCCIQKKNNAYWLHTMHYSNILVFLASTKEKKWIKCLWTISIWQIHKDHYQKILSGHRIDDRFSYGRFEIYIQTVLYPNSFLYFLALILFVSYWLVTFQKR